MISIVIIVFIGSPSPPILISNPCNNRTCVNISWIFGSDNTSLLNYNIEIINKSGTMVYSQTLSRTQLIYTIPDPCDYYDAVVTAIYSHSNVSCLQNASMQQLVGGMDDYEIRCISNNEYFFVDIY